MLWKFLLSSDNIHSSCEFPVTFSGFILPHPGWKRCQSYFRLKESDIPGERGYFKLVKDIHSHLWRYLTRRTVTQMSQLSQDCRRMNFSLQDLALKPLARTAGQWSALWGLLIQGLELKPLSIQWFIWCCAVKWFLVGFAVTCFWKLLESLHQFMYVLDYHW